jgi:XTP/dITP diphosphohydrolase
VGSDRPILLASRNAGKVRELAAVLAPLGVRAVGLDEADPDGRIATPEETGRTFAENARQKARYYARAAGTWALADDSGLMVDALDGRPGVRSARYAAEDAPPGADRKAVDAANNARLLGELAGVDEEARTARFVCSLALSDGERILLEATGAFEGRIGREGRGENGFGYDPLFHVPDLGRTAAELPRAEKNAISHRGRAARELARRLPAVLAAEGRSEAGRG